MRETRSVVIAGAGLGGLRVAQELRRLRFPGRVILIGEEPHAPYDRPPLSKGVLRGTRSNPPTLLDQAAMEALDLTLLVGKRVDGLNPKQRIVTLDDGAEIPYDMLVIATGARARPWRMATGASNVWPLRSSTDAAAIAGVIQAQGHLAVVGAGFIGCEVAASAREMGCPVAMIEILAAPLARVIGTGPGHEVARRHASAGVDLRCGTTVDDVTITDGSVTAVHLSDGTTMSPDAIVYGLGVEPNTGWLASSGVAFDDGVVCDATGATSHENIFAVGDVARWVNTRSGRHVRVEHWTTTTEHAAIVAGQIAGGEHERRFLDEVPYFWSDQYGTKIQCLGEPGGTSDVSTVMDATSGGRRIYLYSRDGLVVGAVGFGAPRPLMRLRPLIAERASVAQALELVQHLDHR